jgi:DNA-directed RNA polymerase subunit RPC12/RpoP
MEKIKEIQCPSCKERVRFERDRTGKWKGRLVGGGVGTGVGVAVGAGLGLAGAIAGAPIAIPALLVLGPIGLLLGAFTGNAIASDVAVCPACSAKIEL